MAHGFSSFFSSVALLGGGGGTALVSLVGRDGAGASSSSSCSCSGSSSSYSCSCSSSLALEGNDGGAGESSLSTLLEGRIGAGEASFS